ncbi:hypothetical protein ABB37_06321 [Leptomonas pyrrhocoris]|uniref:Uncharacterized protein n=1 Tax=Leptomonas pyrrhocoris TaxID=157538 RepID=A0A0M9FXS0_LEPPY|nr:hypothetical protein ABB37_06321 [Leptomonas pyrrhocoris]KPA78143.1 hypothetical protein ABB37_06321 [Leptomonas pyrrhocoris]|eukprot:XP_015656582.1 hypothetical protein ABB37_06321 [Leptomonas pyrrhocoris]
MWYRSVSRACCHGPASTAAFLRWQPRAVQRRWASSSSGSSNSSGGGGGGHGARGFRAGAVDPTPFQVKPNFNIPLWQPPARFMKYRAVRWLSNNLLALATYQMALEVGFTIVFGSLLYADVITAQGVCDGLERYRYPFVSWIDLSDCVYTEPIKIGPFSLNPQKMTALHTGHNIANGLLPVQVLLMLSTFAPVHRLYRVMRHLPPVAASAAAGKTAVSPGAAATVAHPARRASYARTSAKSTPPRQPF